MIRRIFNYELQPEGKQVIMMPKGAHVIGLTKKYGFPFLLAVVDEDQPVESRVFRVVTTGEVFNYSILDYVGTLRLGGELDAEPWYTMHVFEVEMALLLDSHHAEPVDPRNDKYRNDLSTLSTEFTGQHKVARDDFWPDED